MFSLIYQKLLILIDKLSHYGIRGVVLDWMIGYRSDRKQFVQLGTSHSNYQTIKCGVPRGSILDPLLFTLYINDLPNASTLTESILFAEDTCKHILFT